MDYSTWQLSDVIVTQNKAKICILNSNGLQISIKPTETPIRTPFGPSRFDKTQTTRRHSLEFRCNPEIMESFARFDEWAVSYLTEHSERIFKKPLTKEQIVEMYRSPISQKGDYPAILRTKINLDVGGTCRFWTTEGTMREPPANWKTAEFVPHLTIRNLWITGAMCGVTLEVNDLQVHDAPQKCCPF